MIWPTINGRHITTQRCLLHFCKSDNKSSRLYLSSSNKLVKPIDKYLPRRYCTHKWQGNPETRRLSHKNKTNHVATLNGRNLRKQAINKSLLRFKSLFKCNKFILPFWDCIETQTRTALIKHWYKAHNPPRFTAPYSWSVFPFNP